MPQSLPELQAWITDVAAQVDTAMLKHTWEEFQYRLDICCITHGAHTEHIKTKLEVFLYMYQVM
jgi:hypothetical protein